MEGLSLKNKILSFLEIVCSLYTVRTTKSYFLSGGHDKNVLEDSNYT